MKPPVILIIKTGSTYPDLKAESGDFDAWIKKTGGDADITWKIKPVADVEPEKIGNYQGIIITGAHSSLTQFYAFYSGMERVVERLLAQRIFTLGICFGHQLIHKIMGGVIITNPLGTEMGVVTINLTMQGFVDPVFHDLGGSKIQVYASHSDVVSQPAPDFIRLAWNDLVEYQATRYDNFIYTTQFHPEYNKKIMRHYLLKNIPLLAKQHLHNPLHIPAPEIALQNNKSLPKNARIVRNFINLIANQNL